MTDREIIEDFKDLVEESRQEDVYEYYYKLLNVLNLIQKQDKKIKDLKEHNSNLIKKSGEDIDLLLKQIDSKDTEINKLNNVIDRMAEVLNNHDLDYLDLCSKCKNNNEECHGDYCEERIKEYFMKEDK